MSSQEEHCGSYLGTMLSACGPKEDECVNKVNFVEDSMDYGVYVLKTSRMFLEKT